MVSEVTDSLHRGNGWTSRFLHLRSLLTILVLLYGAIAGLRTVADFDLGWQMSEAFAPLHSGDTLSYTAHGAPWIYPRLAGIIFRTLFHLGGYAAISYFCAAALLLTLLILAVRSGVAVQLLLLLAMPALAAQMIPRSGLFTVVFAAAYVRLLLDYYSDYHSSGHRHSLWLLPAVMVLWVNLHPGFIAGLAILLGYLLVEATELLSAARRSQALARLRAILPWIVASALATLANPWGIGMYRSVIAQARNTSLQSSLISEVAPLYREFSLSQLHSLGELGSVWWLMIASGLALLPLLRQKRAGLALFLALAIAVCLVSARSQGIFVAIACLVAGSALETTATRLKALRRLSQPAPALLWTVAAALLLFTGWRCAAIVTDRSSLREGEVTLFGAGPSWWLPQNAAAFIDQHHLPTQLFSTLNLSSYLTWRLGPHYSDFADGRYLVFGDRLVSEQLNLAMQPLDSSDWRKAEAQYGIRTIVFPLARFFGIEGIPLRQDCASRDWAPVYLDPQAIVFVLRDSLPPGVTPIDCQQQPLRIPSGPRMLRYQMLANAAVIDYSLGRNQQAQTAIDEALRISRDDASLLVLEGQLQATEGHFDDAEATLRRALALHEDSAPWYQLGLLYGTQHRYADAVNAFRHALRTSVFPSADLESQLARAQILNGAPYTALDTLAKARRAVRDSGSAGARARAQIDDIAAIAYSQLGNWPAAVISQEQAVHETPDDARQWQILAAMYTANGQKDQAAHALEQADSLAQPQTAH